MSNHTLKKLVKINELTGKFCLKNEVKTWNVFDQVKTKIKCKDTNDSKYYITIN